MARRRGGLTGCVFRKFSKGQVQGSGPDNRVRFKDCRWYNTPPAGEQKHVRYENCKFQTNVSHKPHPTEIFDGCTWRVVATHDHTSPDLTKSGGVYRLTDCESYGSTQGVEVGGDADGVILENFVSHNPQYSHIKIAPTTAMDDVIQIRGGNAADNDNLTLDDTNAQIREPEIDLHHEAVGGFSISALRPRINGVLELNGAPTGSNYGVRDAGLEILDTSVSPPDEYRVLRDGTLAGPL